MKKKTFETLRKNYSKFSFDEIKVVESDNIFHVSYFYTLHANVEDAEDVENIEDINFTHTIIIPNSIDKKNPEDLSSAIFYLGVAEIVNYWKIACPKIIEIKTGYLDEYQKQWFKNIFYNGLGEFMYLNNIVVSEKDFFEFKIENSIPETVSNISSISLSENILLPIGGGKDSIVSYELLKQKFSKEITLFAVNAIKATKRLFEKAKSENINSIDNINIQRILDKKIVECNADGFLNGHVPFSALLGFIAIITSLLHNKKYILLSNESSANEENVVFEGLKVNHQFSKSLQFENDFRHFVKKYIHKDIEYLSFLRPLSEIQIGKIFAQFPKNFPIFKSCNAGSKKDIWCNDCPKCLFAYIILFPFVKKENMIKIFGQDLFERSDEKMKKMFHELIDETMVKPFECVGTYSEVNLALKMSLYQYEEETLQNYPILLQEYISEYLDEDFEELNILENSNELIKVDFSESNLDKIPKEFGECIKL